MSIVDCDKLYNKIEELKAEIAALDYDRMIEQNAFKQIEISTRLLTLRVELFGLEALYAANCP